MKQRKAYRLWLILPTVAIILMLGLYALAFTLFPSDITIKRGEEAILAFNLPLKGILAGKDLAVSVNSDKKTEENITLDFASPLTLKADNTGTGTLKMSFLGIPVKSSRLTVLPDRVYYPGGYPIGLELDTDGVLVLGTGEVRLGSGKYESPCKGLLKSGDLIKKADGVELTDKESLINYIEECNRESVSLTIERRDELIKVEVVPVVSSESRERKLGIWVRDSTQGIGTLTCYSNSGSFYALGHPVTDVDTGNLMKIRDGKLMSTGIISVNKGVKGNPGELVGNTDRSRLLGRVTGNNEGGIRGSLYNLPTNSTPCEIGLKGEVHKGKASILVTTEGSTPKEYEIEIGDVSPLCRDITKSMTIEITDKELIEKTGGIVQGMSGSPILQDGKLIGAVTHVFIQNPTKGYGIFIEDMLDTAE